MLPFTGIRYSETVGELTDDMPKCLDQNEMTGDVTSLHVRFTPISVACKNFSLTLYIQPIYSSALTKGEGLKTTDITRTCELPPPKVGQT